MLGHLTLGSTILNFHVKLNDSISVLKYQATNNIAWEDNKKKKTNSCSSMGYYEKLKIFFFLLLYINNCKKYDKI